MQELRTLAIDGTIAQFAEQPLFDPGVVTGMSLRIDAYWLSWFEAEFWRLGPWPSPLPQRVARVHFGRGYDFEQRPRDWSDYCRSKKLSEHAHPVSVVVILRSVPPSGVPETWPRMVGSHPVIYEYRPEAQLQALSPGDAVKGGLTGTLGGYLWRTTDGQHFALSCAHVFNASTASTGSSVYAGGSYIGNVVESHFPPPSSAKCNRKIQTTTTSGNLDVGVADLVSSPVMHLSVPHAGKVATVTSIAQLGQSDPVILTGAVSGTLHGKIKECNIWKELTFNGSKYCFSDLLVIEDTTHHYVASAFTKDGDSGAWVVNTTGGHVSWDAMHIAGDGANSYCCYAENIMAAIDPNLSLPP